jgi:hypothetical protein
MPFTRSPRRPARPRRTLSRVVAACAIATPLLAAASLANCTSDDSNATPNCANGGAQCFDASSSDSTSFPSPDAPTTTLPDGTVADTATDSPRRKRTPAAVTTPPRRQATRPPLSTPAPTPPTPPTPPTEAPPSS